MDPDIYCEKVAPMYWSELGEELSPEQCADRDAEDWLLTRP